METASGSAPAAAMSVPGAGDDTPTCDRCGDPFRRRGREPLCASCRAARDAEILRLAPDARSFGAIGREVGCSADWARMVVREAGIEVGSARRAEVVRLARDEDRSLYAIARELGCSERWARGVLREAGLEVRPAACSPERRALAAKRREQAVTLKRANRNMSAEAIGERVGVGETQALRILHDADIETPRRPPAAQATEAANKATRAAIRERDRQAEELRLWTADKAGEELVLREPSLVHLRRGEEPLLPPARWIKIRGFRFPLYDPYTVKLFLRRRREDDNPFVRMHRDPEKERRWARSCGHSRQKADELAARAEARDAAEKKPRAGIKHASEMHERWRRLLAELEAEQRELAEALGEPPPEPAELLADVALRDWLDHPEDWPRERYGANRNGDDFADGQVRKLARQRVKIALSRMGAL